MPHSVTSDSTATSPTTRDGLASGFREVRALTEKLCAPLETEDYVIQSMPDASPAKWHLAHTSWFFETFLLKPARDGKSSSPDEYAYLFNSYYNALGERIARQKRGLLSRPTVAEIYRYRQSVDRQILEWLDSADEAILEEIAPLFVLGLNHEQQHQELILTDLKHAFGSNPVRPAYREWVSIPAPERSSLRWINYAGGLAEIGFEGTAFAFDNESPRHKVYVEPHRLANRLVTNEEYLAFIEDGGYEKPVLWLSDGWNAKQSHGWTAPLYWEPSPGGWKIMTLSGEVAMVPSEPVCHISFYEADAFSRWAGGRLPREDEWELAAKALPILGNFLESEQYHPRTLAGGAETAGAHPWQMFGDVWEWTSSPYSPYPGFRPAAGALGEYNGKFMCNQIVLRGGSCVTPRSHLRPTYRNFFSPEARWQFAGLRLAQDV